MRVFLPNFFCYIIYLCQMRFFMELSFNGTNYHGWQVQPEVNSIQEELNNTLSIILKENIQVIGAGRTDAGVHANQMYAHFDTLVEFDINTTIYKINSLLPPDILVKQIFNVDENAHCRFDAIARTYKYYITNDKDPFNPNIYVYKNNLDVNAMNKACNYLLGEQDFTSFAKSHTQTFTNLCNIMDAYWKDQEQLVFTIKANRFLRNMVRSIVGTLLDVGRDKISSHHIQHIIQKQDRGEAGSSDPAKALFLTKIEYSVIFTIISRVFYSISPPIKDCFSRKSK